MHLLQNATVYAPAPLGVRHVLVAGDTIVWMGTEEPHLPAVLDVETWDLEGRRVVPGFIDLHTHLTGGGGETGYASRVPPMVLSQFTTAGVTTAVGLLGTDDIVRTPADVLAAARGLAASGLTAYCWTGGSHLPPATITGSVRGDLCHIDLVVGVGEVAISDHRSSQPTLDELLRVAADAHVGVLMTGKAGVLHLHVGDGPRGLDLVRQALETSEIPARVFHPTHVNRRRALVDEAFDVAARGCTIDVTAFPPSDDEDEVDAPDVLARYFESDLPPELITISSDGGGCLPVFDAQGQPVPDRHGVGTPAELVRVFQALVQRGVPLEQALGPFTAHPARLLHLARVGALDVGMRADLLVLGTDHAPTDVMARGRWMVRDGSAVVHGPFES